MKLKQNAMFVRTALACVLTLGLSPMVIPANADTLTVGSTAEARYTSIREAISQAQDGDTIEVLGSLQESGRIDITKQLAILSNQDTTLTLDGFDVGQHGSLTFGGGNNSGNLTFTGSINNYGTLVVRDGLTVLKGIASYDGSTYRGEGGTFKGEVKIETQASVAGKITGGNYIYEKGDAFGVYGTYDEIAGGTFKSLGEPYDRATVYVQGTLNKISGGHFESTGRDRSALHVQHGGVIHEISGGTFTAEKRALVIYANGTQTAQVDLISGGEFTARYSIMLAGSGNVGIGEIADGTFTGQTSALQIEHGPVIDKISGGHFESRGNGILNVGHIKSIEDGVFQARNYAIFNWTNGAIDTINGGIFIGGFSGVYNKSGGTIQAITNGTFHGGINYAYENASDVVTHIEPSLTEDIGNGRYWGERDAISGKVSYPDGYHMSSRETVLPAEDVENASFRYLKKAYTLSYNANGGTGNKPADQTETADTNVFEVAANPFTFEGKKFTGWNTAADGSGKAFKPGEEISLSAAGDDGAVPLGDTVLYAQWQPVYTIVYDTNGASETAPVDEQEYAQDDAVTVSGATLTKKGFAFKGWKLDKVYKPGDNFTLTADIAALAQDSTLTLVAQWEETPQTPSNDGNKPGGDTHQGGDTEDNTTNQNGDTGDNSTNQHGNTEDKGPGQNTPVQSNTKSKKHVERIPRVGFNDGSMIAVAMSVTAAGAVAFGARLKK